MKLLKTCAIAIMASIGGFAAPSMAAQKCTIAWSHYAGWEPWAYVQDTGIMNRWASKYGVEIEVRLIPSYIASIEQYATGAHCGVAATNMDTLTIPAVNGVDTEVLIAGDFSNGNDGIVIKSNSKDLAINDLVGKNIYLVQLSVSHHMLVRALEMAGLTESDIIIQPVMSEEELPAVFESMEEGDAVVTWNPMLLTILNSAENARLVFTSARIPEEIIDMLVVRTDLDERFKKALAGAWFEAMAVMSGGGAMGEEALAHMAQSAGVSVEELTAQLRTTAMFYKAEDAAAFTRSAELKKTMDAVRRFSFDHGLYGDAQSVDEVGIQFPDGSVMGDGGNVMMRFNDAYMQMAADGKL